MEADEQVKDKLIEQIHDASVALQRAFLALDALQKMLDKEKANGQKPL